MRRVVCAAASGPSGRRPRTRPGPPPRRRARPAAGPASSCRAADGEYTDYVPAGGQYQSYPQTVDILGLSVYQSPAGPAPPRHSARARLPGGRNRGRPQQAGRVGAGSDEGGGARQGTVPGPASRRRAA